MPAITRNTPDAPERLLRINDACSMMGIGRTALYEMLAAGILPTVRISENRRAIPLSAIQTWMAERVTEAEAEAARRREAARRAAKAAA